MEPTFQINWFWVALQMAFFVLFLLIVFFVARWLYRRWKRR
jgi:hypothetical protein